MTCGFDVELLCRTSVWVALKVDSKCISSRVPVRQWNM
jgi:hypothetical protein